MFISDIFDDRDKYEPMLDDEECRTCGDCPAFVRCSYDPTHVTLGFGICSGGGFALAHEEDTACEVFDGDLERARVMWRTDDALEAAEAALDAIREGEWL